MTGSYAIQGSGQSWMTTPIVANNKTKVRKVKAPTTILHPIFTQLQEFTTDPMWSSIFGQAALGKFPKGYLYRDGSLSFKRRTKTFRLDFDLTLPISELYQQCQTFFRNTSGLQSENEAARPTQSQSVEEIDEWRLIPKKNRGFMIRNYVRKMANTKIQRDQLLTMINLGMYLGYLTNSDVEVSDGMITHIHGLTMGPNQKYDFEAGRKPNPLKRTRTEEEPVEKLEVNFLNEWNKFLDYYDRR